MVGRSVGSQRDRPSRQHRQQLVADVVLSSVVLDGIDYGACGPSLARRSSSSAKSCTSSFPTAIGGQVAQRGEREAVTRPRLHQFHGKVGEETQVVVVVVSRARVPREKCCRRDSKWVGFVIPEVERLSGALCFCSCAAKSPSMPGLVWGNRPKAGPNSGWVCAASRFPFFLFFLLRRLSVPPAVMAGTLPLRFASTCFQQSSRCTSTNCFRVLGLGGVLLKRGD
ncbi:hypothetical protein B0H63DRAFT_3869 [Podospora didyma]|uniref:Uncharacterized protein n=1 Tax=Podospora didyma TaxID=330526 RepID=A0AAE0U6Z9_9PEZI|nr:hypothetical protein B0H63DRAFT_3869 [Podospora didyma]